MGHKDRSLPVFWRVGVALVFALLLLAALFAQLEDLPPLWWDEGWTLTVARTWVERGHYGRLSGGELAPPGLQAAFPVVVPVALSFHLFGVGVWQARAVIVLFSAAAMALIYHLARRLYNRPVAIATVLVLLLTPAYREAQPLIMARMVLAEMPMLFFALAGYACFLPALRRPLLLLPLAIALWGIALFSKAQILPFWAVSLALPLLMPKEKSPAVVHRLDEPHPESIIMVARDHDFLASLRTRQR